jgi:NAD dependent epimerase/dehydratase family enzyme
MSILILEGQKVLPEKSLKDNFQFSHSSLDDALSNILQSS